MSESELYGEMWLLAYEANVRQWLLAKGNVDFVAGDTSFAHLKNNNVRFYKPVRRPTRRVAKSLPDWRSDYDESDDEEWVRMSDHADERPGPPYSRERDPLATGSARRLVKHSNQRPAPDDLSV